VPSAATASSSSRTRWTFPLNRSTDSTRRWTDASTLGRGSAVTVTLGSRSRLAKTPSAVNSPDESATRSKNSLACSRRSPGSTSATQERGGR